MQVDESPFGFGQAAPAGDERQVQGIPQPGPRPAQGPPDGPWADAEQAGQFPLTGSAEVDEAQQITLPERDDVEEPSQKRLRDAEAAEFAAR